MREIYSSLIAFILSGVLCYFVSRANSYGVGDSVGCAVVIGLFVGFLVLVLVVGIRGEMEKKALKKVNIATPEVHEENKSTEMYYDDWETKYGNLTVEDLKYMSLEELRDFLDDYLDDREAYEELMNKGKLSRSAKDAILIGVGFGLTNSALNGGHSSNSGSGS